MGNAIRESSIRTRLRKVTDWVCFLRQPRKRTVLVCVCGRYLNRWKETKYQSDVESTHEGR